MKFAIELHINYVATAKLNSCAFSQTVFKCNFAKIFSHKNFYFYGMLG